MSNYYLSVQGSDLPFSHKSMVSITHGQNIICSKTQLDSIVQEQTIICKQFFVGHVVCSRPMKRKKKMHQMIIKFIVTCVCM